MSQMKEYCQQTVYPELMKELGLKNVFQVPTLKKIVINVGIGTYVSHVNKDFSLIEKTLMDVTGQKPVLKRSKIAVSNFNKLRKGEPNGLTVTLRDDRMYQFLEKLIHLTLPRVRDFRGVSAKSFDGHGNYNLGLRDHTVFQEVHVDDAIKPHGMQITIVTSAQQDDHARLLLSKLQFPFAKKNIK